MGEAGELDDASRIAPDYGVLMAIFVIVLGTVGPLSTPLGANNQVYLVLLATTILGHRSSQPKVQIASLIAGAAGVGLAVIAGFGYTAVAVVVGTIVAEGALVEWPTWWNRMTRTTRIVPLAVALQAVAAWQWARNESPTRFAVPTAVALVVLELAARRGRVRVEPREMKGRQRVADGGVVQPVRLDIGLLAGIRAKHTQRLFRDVTTVSAGQGLWWLLPVVGIVVVVMAMASATTATVPYLVYTLF